MSSDLELLGLTIKRLQSRHHRAMDRRLAALGISLVQWNALREIRRNPGSSAHALAELTFNSDQAFGTLVTRLEKLGFVTRESGKGRALLHSLTPAGLRMHDEGYVVHREFVQVAFAPLSVGEQDTLLDLLTKLMARSKHEPL